MLYRCTAVRPPMCCPASLPPAVLPCVDTRAPPRDCHVYEPCWLRIRSAIFDPWPVTVGTPLLRHQHSLVDTWDPPPPSHIPHTHTRASPPHTHTHTSHYPRPRRRHQYTTITDWTGGLYISPGFAGSRSGALIATAWASLVHLGEEGLLAATGEFKSSLLGKTRMFDVSNVGRGC